jgi:hypothetical protein
MSNATFYDDLGLVVFTYHFAQGLRGEADHANEGLADSSELFSYARAASDHCKRTIPEDPSFITEPPMPALPRLTPSGRRRRPRTLMP